MTDRDDDLGAEWRRNYETLRLEPIRELARVRAAARDLRLFVSGIEADVANRFVVRSAAADVLARTAWLDALEEPPCAGTDGIV